jgi:tight adherence protein B
MIAFVLAVTAALGTGLLVTRTGAPAPTHRSATRVVASTTLRARFDRVRIRMGLTSVAPRELAAVSLVLALFGAAAGWVVFGGVVSAFVLAVVAASAPAASARVRADARRAKALESWPRLIEEIRILTGSLGRSIPHALLDVGRRGPVELRGAFDAAHREWMLSTDFARTTAVLKAQLADPTADAVCETLLVAHEVGGSDLDRRLEALAVDRAQDCQGRKDARSRQAGARFARRFVLLVPLGMALAGMSVGEGRDAYRTTTGQVLVLVAIGLVVLCWLWASRIMRLPTADRVCEHCAACSSSARSSR